MEYDDDFAEGQKRGKDRRRRLNAPAPTFVGGADADAREEGSGRSSRARARRLADTDIVVSWRERGYSCRYVYSATSYNLESQSQMINLVTNVKI